MCVLPGLRGDVRGEWDEVKQHDVLFLLTIRPPTAREVAEMRTRDLPPSIMELAGLTTVRGAEVIEVKDEGAPAPHQLLRSHTPHRPPLPRRPRAPGQHPSGSPRHTCWQCRLVPSSGCAPASGRAWCAGATTGTAALCHHSAPCDGMSRRDASAQRAG